MAAEWHSLWVGAVEMRGARMGVETVLAAARGLVERMPQVAAFAGDWPEGARRRIEPASLPVCAALTELEQGAAALTRDLVRAVALAAPALRWQQTYGAGDFGAGFLQGYGWSEVAGLRGPVPSDRLAIGVLLLGSQITYPSHAHAAEEIYVPLSGTALWQRGDAPFAAVEPGQVIGHPSWMPHAMRTQSAPLLALYLWRGGDLAAKSVILDPPSSSGAR
jgi:mannose-6-phosphate isomerase-like protein (cupin superfamily)